MKKFPKKIYAWIVLGIAIVLAFWVFLFHPGTPGPKNIPSDIPSSESATIQHAVLIIGDTSTQISFSSGKTLYDALLTEKKNGLMSFSGKEYSGLGFFVTDIGTLHQGGGKYPTLFINGKEASVGISSYVLKDGDEITWKLR